MFAGSSCPRHTPVPEAAAFCQEHWLHGAAPMILVGLLLLCVPVAIGKLLKRQAGDQIEEDAAQMAYMRRYTALRHRSDNDA